MRGDRLLEVLARDAAKPEIPLADAIIWCA
jgi:hypothetical protein